MRKFTTLFVMVYNYSLFGVTISTDTKLPLHPAGSNVPDYIVSFEEDPRCKPTTKVIEIINRSHFMEFLFPEFGYARISGKEIEVHHSPQSNSIELALLLVESVFPLLLALDGALLLHATTVSKSQNAISFIGPSCSGKSTIAAHCLLNGWDVLSEDITMLRFDEEAEIFTAIQGSPFIALRKESSAFFASKTTMLSSAGGKDLISVHPAPPATLREIRLLCSDTDICEVFPPSVALLETLLPQICLAGQQSLHIPEKLLFLVQALASKVSVVKTPKFKDFSSLDSISMIDKYTCTNAVNTYAS